MHLNLEYQLKDDKHYRYYKITLQKDLLGYWLVCRYWGGLSTRINGHSKKGFKNLTDAFKFICYNHVRRCSRKYNLIKQKNKEVICTQ